MQPIGNPQLDTLQSQIVKLMLMPYLHQKFMHALVLANSKSIQRQLQELLAMRQGHVPSPPRHALKEGLWQEGKEG